MKLWVVTAAVVLGVCGSAGAEQIPYAPGPAMQRWQTIAAERFPSACEPDLYVVPQEDVPLYTRSGEDPPLAYSGRDSPPDRLCWIALMPEFFNQPREYRCTLIVHEYGHLARLSHSSDPASIMYPDPPITAAKRCWHPRHWG